MRLGAARLQVGEITVKLLSDRRPGDARAAQAAMNQTCTDCNKPSPPSRSDNTLLSAAYGWRLQRTQSADGAIELHWRCPACWRRYKQALEQQAYPTPLESPRGIFRAAARLFRRDTEKPPASKG
jgi:hypothetical protein